MSMFPTCLKGSFREKLKNSNRFFLFHFFPLRMGEHGGEVVYNRSLRTVFRKNHPTRMKRHENRTRIFSWRFVCPCCILFFYSLYVTKYSDRNCVIIIHFP